MSKTFSSYSKSPGPETHLDLPDEFTDSSSMLYSMYLSRVEGFDKDQVQDWKGGADGVLVFTGLFAASLATFLVDSYKYLQPDTGDGTIVLLSQISQQLAGISNGSHISIPSTIPSQAAFHPSNAALWVNAFWYMSFIISLFCALLATLLQQWARRYARITQPRCSIHKRARVRTFYAVGVERFRFALAVEAIPTLIHLSVFLFLAGLVIFLFGVNQSIAYATLATTVACALLYTAATVLPSIYLDCPYQTPLSPLVWRLRRMLTSAVRYAAKRAVERLDKKKDKELPVSAPNDAKASTLRGVTIWLKGLSKLAVPTSLVKAAEAAALHKDVSPELDARALAWTLDTVDEEHELEQFSRGIIHWVKSKFVRSPANVIEKAVSMSELHPDLGRDISYLYIRSEDPGTLTDSKVLPPGVRDRRKDLCLRAMYEYPGAMLGVLRRADKDDSDTLRRAYRALLASEHSWKLAQDFIGPLKGKRVRTDLKSLETSPRPTLIPTFTSTCAPRPPSTISSSRTSSTSSRR
ncbi:hypothetical protein BC834DRAFT_550401 [Gloeopeniophorella convolvens]|nr:hypothetical protein BC834DRAFT_550401 [Gloeopeniophorella convolvens]